MHEGFCVNKHVVSLRHHEGETLTTANLLNTPGFATALVVTTATVGWQFCTAHHHCPALQKSAVVHGRPSKDRNSTSEVQFSLNHVTATPLLSGKAGTITR